MNQATIQKSGQAPKSNRRGLLTLLGVFVAGMALLLTACSSGNDAGEIANPENLQASAVQVEGSDANLVAKFPIPSKAENLSTNDLKVGEGTAAAIGSTVQTKYWLFAGTTGEMVDSSTVHSPEGIDFELRQGQLVQGFIDGMVGIQAGGERVIVIPGNLAYGENPPAGLAKNETLVFVVQAVKVS